MPLYEYECETGHRFEKRQTFRSPALKTCPTHSKASVERVLFARPVRGLPHQNPGVAEFFETGDPSVFASPGAPDYRPRR